MNLDLKTIPHIGVILLLSLIFWQASPPPVLAASCTTITNGYWNIPTTWDCGHAPNENDDVTIDHTVDMSQDEKVNNLTIHSGGTLNLNGHLLTVYGSWTNQGTFDHGGGTIEIFGSGSHTLVGNTTFCDLTINLITGATFDWGNGTTTIIDGDLSKGTDGTLNPGTNTTVRFTGNCKSSWFGSPSVNISGPGAKRFVHLEISSNVAVQYQGGSLYLFGNMTNDGSFTQDSLLNTTFDDDATHTSHTLSGTGDTTFGKLSVAGGNTLTAQTDFTIQGANFNVASGGDFQGGSHTVTFAGTTSLAGAGDYHFHHIQINSGSTLNGKSAGDHTIYVSGDWTNDGTFNHSSDTVIFNGGSQTIGGASTTTFYNMIINNGTTVIVPVSNQPQVDGVLTNNGSLQQASTTGDFLHILSSSGGDRYRGLYLSTVPSFVTVVVQGHQNTCPHVASGSHPVKRCFSISGGVGSSQATFYYQHDELQPGQDPSLLYLWKDNGDGSWTKIPPSARSGCAAGAIDCSVTINSLTLSLGETRYVLAQTNPQAVALAQFQAHPHGQSIQLIWETVSEYNILGFHLYRAPNLTGPWTRLNTTLIPSLSPGSSLGHTYTWHDHPPPAPLSYRLTIIGLNGEILDEETLSVEPPPSTYSHRIWLPQWMFRR